MIVSSTTRLTGELAWQLEERQTGIVLASGSSLDDPATDIDSSDGTDVYFVHQECIESNDFVFRVTNTEGNGLGEEEHCEECSYSMWLSDRQDLGDKRIFAYTGYTGTFHYDQLVLFSVPLPKSAPPDPPGSYGSYLCDKDFNVAVLEMRPAIEITWTLSNEDGETVLTGE